MKGILTLLNYKTNNYESCDKKSQIFSDSNCFLFFRLCLTILGAIPVEEKKHVYGSDVMLTGTGFQTIYPTKHSGRDCGSMYRESLLPFFFYILYIILSKYTYFFNLTIIKTGLSVSFRLLAMFSSSFFFSGNFTILFLNISPET